MRFIPSVVALLSLALSTGCGILGLGEFVDFDAYEPLPPLDELEFPETAAGDDVVYWELRRSWDPGSPENDEVLLTGGFLSRGDLDAELLATFDSTSSFDGFANHSCLPASCPAYLVSIDKRGSVDIWDEPEGMQSILPPLESVAEAALIAFAFDYEWFPSIERGAFRRVDDTWELVVTKVVEFCDPVRTDRFLLGIEDGGQVAILKQEEYQSSDGVCI